MSSPFVAEIRMFGFNFAPKGWAFCDGQLLPISQNTALFSLLGTMYGGDGKSTFALPDLQGSCAVHQGDGGGLSPRFIGEQSGTEFVTLLQSEMPFHTHNMMAQNAHAATNPVADPTQGIAHALGSSNVFSSLTDALVPMSPSAITPAGGSLPHNNMQPYLCVNFCIAMQGVFPPRT